MVGLVAASRVFRGQNKRYPVANKKMVGIISLYSNYPVGIMRFGVLILSHMG